MLSGRGRLRRARSALAAHAGVTAIVAGPAVVAWTSTEAAPDWPARLTRLSSSDRDRADGFGADRRREFLAARSLVAAVIAGLFPDADRWSVGAARCGRCGARHGAVEAVGVPVVAGIAHTSGLVVAAAAPAGRVGRLGVDVELNAADAERTRDLERLLGQSSTPVLRRWTRLEAVLKADGRGLAADPASVRFRGGTARIGAEAARYRVLDVTAPAGCVISLAWCAGGASAAVPGPATR